MLETPGRLNVYIFTLKVLAHGDPRVCSHLIDLTLTETLSSFEREQVSRSVEFGERSCSGI